MKYINKSIMMNIDSFSVCLAPLLAIRSPTPSLTIVFVLRSSFILKNSFFLPSSFAIVQLLCSEFPPRISLCTDANLVHSALSLVNTFTQSSIRFLLLLLHVPCLTRYYSGLCQSFAGYYTTLRACIFFFMQGGAHIHIFLLLLRHFTEDSINFFTSTYKQLFFFLFFHSSVGSCTILAI